MIFQTNGIRIENSAFVLQQQWIDADKDSKLMLNPNVLLELVNREYQHLLEVGDGNPFDRDSQCGNAPFSKIITIPLTDSMMEHPLAIRTDRVKISDENASQLVFGYESRAPGELRMPTRSIPCLGDMRERARFLQVILYSDEQLAKEDTEKPNREFEHNLWSVVLYRGQNTDKKLPMEDSTMLRNALEIDEGGSAVPIDPKAWEECISHWEEYVKYSPSLDTNKNMLSMVL